MQLIAFLKLIRYKNLVMVLLTLVVSKYALIHPFTTPYLSNFQFSMLSLSILLITAGGYIINDIFDVEADKINKPNKIFIDESISKKNAYQLYYILTILGMFLGVYVSFLIQKPWYSVIFLGTAFGLYVYSSILKQLPFIGNIVVSILIGLSMYTLSLFEKIDTSSSLFYVLLVYITFSFLTTLVREVIKDIEDVNGDNILKMNTLPIILGRKTTAKIAFVITGILFIITIVIIRYLYDVSLLFFIYALVFTVLPLSYFLFKLWEASTTKHFHFLSKLMKLIMFFGILSMLLFKFI